MPGRGFKPVTLKDEDFEILEKIIGKLPVADAAAVRATIRHAARCKHFDLTVEA